MPAVDAMRGIVMVFMALDHASHAFNAARYAADSYIWYHAGAKIPAAQFLMFLILAFLFAWYRTRNPSAYNPLQVFGRTPLFFYLIHVHLLAAGAWVLNVHQTGGWRRP